jgi:hypothetical protein
LVLLRRYLRMTDTKKWVFLSRIKEWRLTRLFRSDCGTIRT